MAKSTVAKALTRIPPALQHELIVLTVLRNNFLETGGAYKRQVELVAQQLCDATVATTRGRRRTA
jgi:hypothetical protein